MTFAEHVHCHAMMMPAVDTSVLIVMHGTHRSGWRGRRLTWRQPAAATGGGAKSGSAACLRTRTASLEQAGGLQRMTLRGHTGGVSKVLLTPGGIDVITGVPQRTHPAHCPPLTSMLLV